MSLLHAIQKIAQEAAVSGQARLLYGRVIAEHPIQVMVDERFVLSEGSLVLPMNMTEQRLRVRDKNGKEQVYQREGKLRTGDKLILLNLGNTYYIADREGANGGEELFTEQ